MKYQWALLSSAISASFIGAFLLAGGCAPQKDIDIDAMIAQSIADGAQLARQSEAVCPNTQDCPAGIGMVVSVGTAGLEQCTGFLIDSNHLVTSAHCLPDDLKRNPSSDCSSRVRISFPETSKSPAANIGCAAIELAETPDKTSIRPEIEPDYAVIRLEKALPMSPLKLSTDGIANNTDYSVVKISKISDARPFGELRTQRCKAVQKTRALPQFDHPLSPVVALWDCPLNHEAAGSPVIASNGTVRAIVHAPFVTRELFQKGLQGNIVGRLSDLAYASNVACTKNPLNPDKSRSSVCDEPYSPEQIKTDFRDMIDSQDQNALRARLDKELSAWASKNTVYIQWERREVATERGMNVIPVPKCIHNPSQWLSKYRKGWSWNYQESAEECVITPVIEGRHTLTSYLQVTQTVFVSAQSTNKLRFSPSQISDSGQSRVTLVSTDLNRGETVIFDGMLGICGR